MTTALQDRSSSARVNFQEPLPANLSRQQIYNLAVKIAILFSFKPGGELNAFVARLGSETVITDNGDYYDFDGGGWKSEGRKTLKYSYRHTHCRYEIGLSLHTGSVTISCTHKLERSLSL